MRNNTLPICCYNCCFCIVLTEVIPGDDAVAVLKRVDPGVTPQVT